LINTLFRTVGSKVKASPLGSRLTVRKRVLVATVVIIIAVSFSLFATFVPVFPAQFTQIPNCQSILCSSISKPPVHGYGSLSYVLFGFGAFSTGFMGSGQYHSSIALSRMGATSVTSRTLDHHSE